MIQDIQQSHISDMSKSIDEKIKERLIENGFNPDDLDYLKNNFSFVERPDDEYKHLFHLPDNKRIISIQKQPDIKFSHSFDDKNTVNVTCDIKYY